MKSYSILLLFTITLQIVNADIPTNTKSKVQGSNSYNSLAAGFSLLFVLLNLLACLFIFYRTFMIWRDHSPFTFSLKFPFYLSFIGFCISVLHIFNLSSIIAQRRILDVATCNLIGVMTIFFISLITNLTVLVSLLIRFSTRNKILIKDEIVMFLISTIFSILFSAVDIGNEKNLNWWCSPVNEPMIPFILSLVYLLFTTFFLISLKLRIKSAKSSTQNESDDTINESQDNNLIGAGNESNGLQVVEIEKITSYIFAVWVQLILLFIYTIIQVAMVDSVVVGVDYMFAISGGVLIFVQYVRNESFLIHRRNQSNPTLKIYDLTPTKNAQGSSTNPTKNWFLGRPHSNTNLNLTPITTNSTSRESYRRSFRDSIRDSFQKIKLPFTKIQVQVVQHQTFDSYSDCEDDGHVRLEIPTISVTSSVS